MNNIGICVNLEKDPELEIANEIISIAKELGVKSEIANVKNKYDFIISLGGDGTFLDTSRKFYNNKIIGVNLGNLGFLSEIDKDSIEEKLVNILNNKYTLEKRLFIEANNEIALNDIVVSKGVLAKMLKSDIYFNGEYVNRYISDGIIISTPTGSTAYSLSAGGPIVDPKVDVLILTPICPHSLHQRPIIVSADTEIKIVTEDKTSLISFDGREPILNEKGSITIKKSNKYVEIIKVTNNNFFDIVRNKFHIN